MEPRLRRRGNGRVPAHARGPRHASMEPRLRRRGNALNLWSVITPFVQLQWSPGFVAGETRSPSSFRKRDSPTLQWSPGFVAGETGRAGQEGTAMKTASMEPRLRRRGNMHEGIAPLAQEDASMEPRLRRRGNTDARHGDGVPLRASMEPRLRRRGNTNAVGMADRVLLLQWSPGFVAGETCFSLIISRAFVELQWSPGFVAGETAGACVLGAPGWELQWSPGFVAGETGAVRNGRRGIGIASMEPRLRRRGNFRELAAKKRAIEASMEPRLRRRGNSRAGTRRASP